MARGTTSRRPWTSARFEMQRAMLSTTRGSTSCLLRAAPRRCARTKGSECHPHTDAGVQRILARMAHGCWPCGAWAVSSAAVCLGTSPGAQARPDHKFRGAVPHYAAGRPWQCGRLRSRPPSSAPLLHAAAAAGSPMVSLATPTWTRARWASTPAPGRCRPRSCRARSTCSTSSAAPWRRQTPCPSGSRRPTRRPPSSAPSSWPWPSAAASSGACARRPCAAAHAPTHISRTSTLHPSQCAPPHTWNACSCSVLPAERPKTSYIRELNRPPWTPPGPVFPIVWTLINLLRRVGLGCWAGVAALAAPLWSSPTPSCRWIPVDMT